MSYFCTRRASLSNCSNKPHNHSKPILLRDSLCSLQLMYVPAETSDMNDPAMTSVIFHPSPLWFDMRRLASNRLSGTLDPPTPAARMLQKVLHDVLSAAAHLQENGVVHRDIKPSNVFCNTPDRSNLEGVQCVLGDFSSGLDAFTLKNFYSSGASKNELTLQYSPPEILFSAEGDSSIRYESTYDSWSIGVLALEMMLGTPDVFSVDQRTSVLLSQRLSKEVRMRQRRCSISHSAKASSRPFRTRFARAGSIRRSN